MIIVACLALVSTAPSAGKVLEVSPQGFEVSATATVAASPVEVYAALIQIGHWWNSEHSYSGDAANMSLDPRAGGCFCERLADGGSVEHLHVVYVQPGKALRLRGALGPLQEQGADGALTWRLTPRDGGTVITQTYVVGGYLRGGPERWAGPVDAVLGEQLARLARFAEQNSAKPVK